jgi:hypothetical protein
MTLPVERMRSLRWGLELLQAIPVDPSLPDAIQRRALDLAPRYPTPEDLRHLLADGAFGLPEDHRLAIHDAAALFDDLRLGGWGSQATRHHLQYVLRHFPKANSVPRMSERPIFGGLSDWIEPEDTYKP